MMDRQGEAYISWFIRVLLMTKQAAFLTKAPVWASFNGGYEHERSFISRSASDSMIFGKIKKCIALATPSRESDSTTVAFSKYICLHNSYICREQNLYRDEVSKKGDRLQVCGMHILRGC